MSLQNNSRNYGANHVVNVQTLRVLNHILSNAAAAVGTGSALHTKGILTVADMHTLAGILNNKPTFCIHQDLAPLADEANDRWFCYTQNTDSNSGAISYCTFSYVPFTSSMDPSNNSNARRGADDYCHGGGITLLETLVPASNFSNSNPSFVLTPEIRFTITVTGRLNPTAAADTRSNPEIVKTGSVSPANHSM
jgi:hypothetical protein